MNKYYPVPPIDSRRSYQHINPARALLAFYPVQVALFIFLHIPLVLLINWDSNLSTVYALFVLALGLFFLLKDKTPRRVIHITAYIIGAELLWRGTGASVFWEYGKYASGFLLILLILKFGALKAADKRPLIYFLLLLPAVFLISSFDRQVIAFQLSGPFLLALSTLYFSTVKMPQDDLKWLLVTIIAPVVGLGFLATFSTLTTQDIAFGSGSIRATAAGIGPNQVSSILGLGALAAFLYIFIDREHKLFRLGMLGIFIWLLSQAALTFSRGGFWTTVGAVLVAAFYLIRQPRARAVFVFACLVIFASFVILFPFLNNFTGGALAARFSDFETTGRGEIIQGDLYAFSENPLFGVGIGESEKYHAIFYRFSASHTEYSRMLAEHGALGIFALLILIWIAAERVFAKQPLIAKAFSVSLTAWAFLFMYHAATRLAAPAYLFGLAAVTILLDDRGETSEPQA